MKAKKTKSVVKTEKVSVVSFENGIKHIVCFNVDTETALAEVAKQVKLGNTVFIANESEIPTRGEDKIVFSFISKDKKIVGATLITTWLKQDYDNPRVDQWGGLTKVFSHLNLKLNDPKTSDKVEEMIYNNGVVNVIGSKGLTLDTISDLAIYDGVVSFKRPEPKVYKPKYPAGIKKGATVILFDDFEGVIIKYPSNSNIVIYNSESHVERVINIADIVEVVLVEKAK